MSSQDYYDQGGRPFQGSYECYGYGYQQQQQQQPQYPQQPHYSGQQQPEYDRPAPYQNYSSPPPPQNYGSPPPPPPQNYGSPPPPQSYGGQYPPQDGRTHSPYQSEYSRPAPPPPPPPPPPPGSQYNDGSAYPGYGGQQTQQQGYPPPGYQSSPQGAGRDDERGFMGALAGGAAGAYGGHKLHHGVLGTIGGAVAGSMMEDHFKHKKDDHQQQQQQQQQQLANPHPPRPHSSHSSHSNSNDGGGGGRALAGNFSASSTQISLDRDYDLIASCTDTGGKQRLSSVSLNDCLRNEWGHLRWGKGGGFAGSARNVRLVDGGRVLEAELGKGDGGWRVDRIRLDERITNQDGELRFLPP